MKKVSDIIEVLEGLPATIISGIFLVTSLILSLFNIQPALWWDPAWIAVIVSGLPLLYGAVKKIICNKGISKISSALLISIAMIAAISIGDLFAAGEVAFIMAIGEILEHKTTNRAKRGLKKLISLSPEQGRRILPAGEEMVPVSMIKEGDILRIFPGEAIPVDGEILMGETSIDQSIITGESLPVDKTIGDSVFCGTINRFGSIDIKATKVGQDSSLQKLIRMVKEAEGKKAPMQRTADKWASWLVPVALVLAVVAGLVKQDIEIAVTMLVVFCPCALVLATPTAIMAAIGQATKHGVIIKSGEALETMGKVDTVALDKTGTLTYGKLQVSDVISFYPEICEAQVLQWAAAAESKSEHPVGKAIVENANLNNVAHESCEDFRMFAGKGISARVTGKILLIGNENFLKENNITLSPAQKNTLSELSSVGKATVIVSDGNNVIGVIALSDVIKENADSVVEKLSSMKTEAVLLTGDNPQAAMYLAQRAGISSVKAGLLPEEKVSCISALQADGKKVCMIGDGVNDAPALKTADVGVAMGTMGSDIAIEAADIALMGDDISKIPYLKRLSVATVRTIKFSITLSLLINFLAIGLSFLGLLNPTTGALVHNAGACFVVLIAAMLYDRKF